MWGAIKQEGAAAYHEGPLRRRRKAYGQSCSAGAEEEELLARLRALERRKGQVLPDNLLRFGDIELNPHTLDLYCKDDSFRLTLKESQLLELLITTRNALTPTSLIIEKLWGYDGEIEDRHVRVHMAFLRKKLRLLSSNVEIQTVRGVGYKLALRAGGNHVQKPAE